MAQTYNWYRTPIGFATIATDGSGITALTWGCENVAGAIKAPTPLTTTAANQLLEYLSGKRRSFDVPLAPKGSPFQQQVWTALQQVPYATSLTATQLAESMGIPASYKAVGAAIKANPLAVLIPDHRVVSATGKNLGSTKEAAQRELLLRFEKQQLQ